MIIEIGYLLTGWFYITTLLVSDIIYVTYNKIMKENK